MTLIIALFFLFASVYLLSVNLVPLAAGKFTQMNESQARTAIGRIDRYLREEELKKLYRLALLGPVAIGAVGFIIFPEGHRWIGLLMGGFFGYLLPRMYVNHLVKVRNQKFNDQLIDAIMIMSSSFRGGLSLVQAFESVADEMPEPAKGEFGIVLGENKMGVSLEESLSRLYLRMPSSAMQQMVTAILLARETGGNLPVIFSRIVSSTRERKKIERSLQALTLQGKIQAVVMTGLPVFFFFTVSGSNPHFFDVMLNSPMGHKLLIICVVLWVLGALTVWKISTFKDL
ncbi:MAG: type II secretion system F family protein [Candidatus Omnitrophica bacterium]|nr:type II secretion system F family protein [Candidatus Omnitrophota bacterium]MDE2009506.1 type II secretion system F family protein [Candidatus Omnitrophota bacterium]MDE2215455.1 type II secretion system F family protein [Candidatus Omnitrophota bacterium]MDE2231627.1 type II secretion system F family protein [Candidatus Omnitrophota bacterium]